MPMTTDQMDVAIRTLQARVDRLAMTSNEQARRIEALERAGSPEQLKRIADALNQFGEQQAGLLQNQSVTKNPAKPWSPV